MGVTNISKISGCNPLQVFVRMVRNGTTKDGLYPIPIFHCKFFFVQTEISLNFALVFQPLLPRFKRSDNFLNIIYTTAPRPAADALKCRPEARIIR